MNIKQNQVIPSKKVEGNQVSGIPRDLQTSGESLPARSNDLIASANSIVPGVGQTAEDVFDYSSAIPEAHVIVPSSPPTPYLLSVKSQTVNPKPDGTFTVDVVLDVSGTTVEYEVRISKDEGNL